jgi:hypothetical protein
MSKSSFIASVAQRYTSVIFLKKGGNLIGSYKLKATCHGAKPKNCMLFGVSRCVTLSRNKVHIRYLSICLQSNSFHNRGNPTKINNLFAEVRESLVPVATYEFLHIFFNKTYLQY